MKTRKFERANILFEAHEYNKDDGDDDVEEETHDANVKCRFFFKKAERKEKQEDNQNGLREIVENAKGRIENIVKEMSMSENDNRKGNVQIKKNLKNLSKFINEVRNKEDLN